MVFNVRNEHARVLSAPVDRVGSLLDTLASENDRLWPSELWPPMRLDRSLAPGADGGHGPIRYRVESYVPGRAIVFRFTPANALFRADGTHGFEVVERDGGVTLLHCLVAALPPREYAKWIAVIRPLHNALIEDALDKAERSLETSPVRSARHSFWVRTLRRSMRRRSRKR